MKKNKTMIIAFITPAILSFAIMFLYPVLRTVFISFFSVESVTAPTDKWVSVGIDNYIKIWQNNAFRVSMFNIFKVWLIGGAIVLSISLLFAVILTSGVRFKSFWRAAIYLPNVISAVALATMWLQFVFQQKYGLINGFFKAIGAESLAKINWLSSDMKFWAMLIAFCFGSVGYYMLIFLSGIERIPEEYYEAATIDGASKWKQFTNVTMPLLKGVFKTNLTFWSINTVMFFVWSKMFSPLTSEESTITPVVYMYNTVFGTTGVSNRDAGKGAAVGVTLAIIVVLIFVVMNFIIKDEEVEY
ncbi:carbohydrate ABC transporter permease [Clostridium celatum]|nr:sugar ABC transporter permease [Clostridium celatum]MCE9656271.1 sugar ABC transporter permease [Clostridium celatum]MDU2266865.1 sugar ABC transporter permease [Clostridium celatum]MDU3722630.1 sugar ABC transporter permease [Clostridium celatum]MDU6297389.1 sugar ABC transporter permease [Clostridium celatum]MDY3359046.1 sugar ABC transporter permease [Clostridium celatum]